MGLRTTLFTVAVTALALRKFEQFHQQGHGVNRPSSFTRSHTPGAGFPTGHGSSAFGFSNSSHRVRQLGGGLRELARAAFSLFDRGVDGLSRHQVQPSGSRYRESRSTPTHYDPGFYNDNSYRFPPRSNATQSTQTEATDEARAPAPSRFTASTTTDSATGDNRHEPSLRSALRRTNRDGADEPRHVRFAGDGLGGTTSRYQTYASSRVDFIPYGNEPVKHGYRELRDDQLARTLIEHTGDKLGSRSDQRYTDIPVHITSDANRRTSFEAGSRTDQSDTDPKRRFSMTVEPESSRDELVSQTTSRHFGEFAQRMGEQI
jgi:hypothetical protein